MRGCCFRGRSRWTGKVGQTGRSGGSFGSTVRVTYDAGEEVGITRRWGEMYLTKNASEKIVPMMGRMAEAVKCFLEELKLIFIISWVTNWGVDDHSLICGQVCLAKCILAISLLENMTLMLAS